MFLQLQSHGCTVMNIPWGYVLTGISILIGGIAAYYAREGLKVSKGEQYKTPPVDVDYLIPPESKYQLDWVSQNENPQHFDRVSLPADGQKHVVIIRIKTQGEDTKVSLSNITLGFSEVDYRKPPLISALRHIFKEPAAGKKIRDEVTPNWHGNIRVPGANLLGGVQIIGLEIKSPTEPGKYTLRTELACREAESSKIVKLPVKFHEAGASAFLKKINEE